MMVQLSVHDAQFSCHHAIFFRSNMLVESGVYVILCRKIGYSDLNHDWLDQKDIHEFAFTAYWRVLRKSRGSVRARTKVKNIV